MFKKGNKLFINNEKAFEYLKSLNEIKESLENDKDKKKVVEEMKFIVKMIKFYENMEFEVMKTDGDRVSFTMTNSKYFPSDIFDLSEEEDDNEEELDYEV